MNTSTVGRPLRSSRELRSGPALAPFLALTFGLTWGLAAHYLVLRQIVAIFGREHDQPLFIWPCMRRFCGYPGLAPLNLKGLGSFFDA
jgi:hypothetical protein